MASTWSALKIELLETGANSGTWGTLTNVNLGDAVLGEAITGSATVDFATDADVTITLTDSATTQSARNLRLNITESSTGVGSVRNLILGSGCQIEKFYLINNTGTGAKTVKNTSGTGISVPAGKATLVYNNGTNVVDAATYFTALTLGSALPVASGGTGITSFGTGVATALGVNTGSAGAFVVNGGALGSPSSVGTMPAFTLGGTVSGGGNQINNVIIGTSTPLAGAFTTVSATQANTSTTLGTAPFVNLINTATATLNQVTGLKFRQQDGVYNGEGVIATVRTSATARTQAFIFCPGNASGDPTEVLRLGDSTGAQVTGTLSATGDLSFSTVGSKVNFATTSSATVNYVGGSADGYSLEMVMQRGALQPLKYKQDFGVGHVWGVTGSDLMTLSSTGLAVGAGSGSPQLKLSGAASSTANSGAQLAFAAAGTPYAYISNVAWIKGGGSTDNNLAYWTDAGLGHYFYANNNATTAVAAITSTGLAVTGTLSSTLGATIQGLTVGLGAGAVATNTAVGAGALAANTTGSYSTAIGAGAGAAQLSGQNIYVGNDAGGKLTTGDQNIGIGISSLGWNIASGNTTGSYNTTVGTQSMTRLSSGSYNTATGGSALGTLSTGSYNNALGWSAGNSLSTGSYNVFIGSRSGSTGAVALTGDSNSCIGEGSGYYLEGVANGNTFLGQNSGSSVTTGTNNVILGRFTGNSGGLDIRAASNYIVLADGAANVRGYFNGSGNSFVTSTTEATSTTAASLVTAGGLGVAKKAYFGDDIFIRDLGRYQNGYALTPTSTTRTYTFSSLVCDSIEITITQVCAGGRGHSCAKFVVFGDFAGASANNFTVQEIFRTNTADVTGNSTISAITKAVGSFSFTVQNSSTAVQAPVAYQIMISTDVYTGSPTATLTIT